MKRLLDLFKKPESAPRDLPDVNVKTVLGALLVRMAKADDNYQMVEIAQIDKILSAAYHLDAVEAAQLRADCEVLEAGLAKTDDLAEVVADTLEYADRLVICDAIWSVMVADDRVYDQETLAFDAIEKALGISHQDSYVIRHRKKPE